MRQDFKYSEEKYFSLLESSTLGIVIHKGDKLIYGNKKILEILGCATQEEFLGKSMMDYIAPEFKDMVLERLKKLPSDELAMNFICNVIHKNCEKRIVEVSLTDFKINGELYRQGIYNDITEKIEIQKKFHESEQMFRSIVEKAFTGIYVMNDSFRFVYANDKLCEMTGYKKEEFIGNDFRQFVADESLQGVVDRYQRRQKGEPLAVWYEIAGIKKNGSRIYFLSSSSVILDSNGRVKTVGQLLDITEQKQIEKEKEAAVEALRISEEKYRNIFNNSPYGILQSTMDGSLIDFNDTFLKLTGYTAEEAKQIYNLKQQAYVHPEDRDILIENLIEYGYVEGYEVELYKKNKEKVWASCNIKLIRDKEGNPSMIEGTFSDITERKIMEAENKRLEEMLFHAQKIESIGRLAGGIAHDFNNLLTAILGNAEMAMSTLKPEEKLYSRLSVIIKAAEGAASLTKQLLAFSRKQIIISQVIDLNDVVNRVSKMIVTLMGENIKLKILPQSDLYKIKADPGQMEQVIINLSSNARDAMFDGGIFTIETSNVYLDEEYCRSHLNMIPGDYVMLAISDTGYGMNKQIMEHLFEPFFTTKPVGKGTGLGLATVYGIVKQTMGNIEVYSEINNGTTFKIYFPAEFAKTEELPQRAVKSEMPEGSETILIIEDNPHVLDFNRDVLSSLGYKVLSAATANEAISISQNYKEDIHLLMTDIILPDMNGRIASEKISEQRPALKTLFNSGYTAEAIDSHGILEEGLNFIAKPFTAISLSLKVRDVLDKK